MTAEEITQKAKQTYPCNYEYKGNLEEKKIEKIKEVCNVNIFSVSMLGNHVYHIKYRKE